ncbi:MAG TPA: excinuclease ABC subunit UvrA, partial [bacterium]|nr:excinuclease ABC subunit UvrA [bacterium]
MKQIEIKGARIHNLKNIDVSIPKNKLIAATGVSGSGKSSLMFDTVFEEGRKQYLQSLGIFGTIEEEDKFDGISGIGPAIAVQQNIIRQTNPRSTVGTRTNILNMLAVLYSAAGKIRCAECDAFVDEKLVCLKCGNTEERFPAGYFSYNNPNGMCLKCSGKGAYFQINMKKLIPEAGTVLKRVFEIAGPTQGYARLLNKRFKDYLETPFLELPDDVKADVIYGHYTAGNAEKTSYCLKRIFEGRIFRNGEDLSGIYSLTTCGECGGYRIGEEARRVFINGKHIGELGKMTITELNGFLQETLKIKGFSSLSENLLKTILHKTNCLIKSRLGHLSLFREMTALSGGELQRVFLNSHLESKMDSLIYILDEPTAGLHESEKFWLLKAIKELKELGNTVIIVEHDRRMIEAAEHIIDIGPKAGIEGGEIIYQGDYNGLLDCGESVTGLYFSGKIPAAVRKYNLKNEKETFITLRNVRTNNLKNINVSLPLRKLVGIAGVSGSGKSSLISKTLIPLLKNIFQNQNGIEKKLGYLEESDAETEVEFQKPETIADRLEGTAEISGFAEVSQAPIGKNMNSNPATYIGIWDKIRKLFAEQPESAERNFTAGHFSFNSKGACSKCGGGGREKIWLGGDFFLYNTCPECKGKRYNDAALSIRYNDKTILDILEMTVSEAVVFFKNNSDIIIT